MRLPVLLAALAALTLTGCAASAPVAPSAAPPAQAPGSGSGDGPTGQVQVGNQVGQRVPDFELELPGNQKVASADLVASNQPAFLFFFATW